MMQPSELRESELHLIVDDDLRHMQEFTIDEDYPDSEHDEMNTVRVSIVNDKEIIAYMEAFIFYENRIDDLVIYADGVSGDAHEAMYALSQNGLLEPFDPDSDSVDDMFDSLFDNEIVHLHYIAVREEYRKQGFGGWLIRNLPRILLRNYGVTPRLISTTICPQDIDWDRWDKTRPTFSPPNDDCDSPDNKAMFVLMEKMFQKNGYHKLGDSEHYYTKPSRA